MNTHTTVVPIERLRALRRRAKELLNGLQSDLLPFFRQDDPTLGFIRTPESDALPGDVNVTTTCSCLMALALTRKLDRFYPDTTHVEKAVGAMFAAPWMSSGLSENNAFTTTLVLRALGFLIEEEFIEAASIAKLTKRWEWGIRVNDVQKLSGHLANCDSALADRLFQLLASGVQSLVREYAKTGLGEDRTTRKLVGEVTRLVRSSAIYDASRFPGFDHAKAGLAKDDKTDQYTAARLGRSLLDEYLSDCVEPVKDRTLFEIAQELAKDPERLRINEYPPAAAVVYWFVDGIHRASITLDETCWKKLSDWSAREFSRQRSLVVAGHAVMMDPVAMAMAACVCARIRFISQSGELGTTGREHETLPSMVELEHSIVELFDFQTPSGIWPKYFPLFHYQEAGSNFCFTFELLEALLAEFGKTSGHLVGDERFIDGLDKALAWCEQNYLTFSKRNADGVTKFSGWNSGGALDTLRKEQPESWATAVVHMFLAEFDEVLSRHIQHRLLEAYKAVSPPEPQLESILDIDLLLPGELTTVRNAVERTILESFKGTDERSLRRKPLKAAYVSALLFGPPGTSKTEFAKAVARELKWPLVQIDPSDFVRTGYEHIYVQAERIFEDLDDLAGAVVFFDEMDALVQNRDNDDAPPDTESTFLTTFMLPKLAHLHDSRRVVFLMATNYQDRFDEAIKRAGRFDLLLCMGPPTLDAKCSNLHAFYGKNEKPSAQTEAAGMRLREMCKTELWLWEQLSLYTFAEFRSFILGLSRDKESLVAVLDNLTAEALRAKVADDVETVRLRYDDLQPLLKEHNKTTVRELDSVKALGIEKSQLRFPAIRYVNDRHHSKIQK